MILCLLNENPFLTCATSKIESTTRETCKAHHGVVAVVVLFLHMVGADCLHHDALDLLVCLEARGVILQLQAFIVHLDHARWEVLQIPAITNMN